jgi:myo-inositol 2-dehydrogenase / D-chiro-inositol 1-dehydrogenase
VATRASASGWSGPEPSGPSTGRAWPGGCRGRLAGVADPAPGAAEGLAARLGCAQATTDPAELLADPTVQAVVIAAPARFHAGLVVAAGAGTAMFCEKPVTALRPKPTASQATSA